MAISVNNVVSSKNMIKKDEIGLYYIRTYDKITNCNNNPCSTTTCRAKVQKEVQVMRNYELSVVLFPTLSEEDKVAALEKVKELIVRFGGEITNVDDWGKRKLAYEIEKQREGFYYFIQFNAETSAPAEIESRIRIMETVLRYLIVSLEDK